MVYDQTGNSRVVSQAEAVHGGYAGPRLHKDQVIGGVLQRSYGVFPNRVFSSVEPLRYRALRLRMRYSEPVCLTRTSILPGLPPS